MRLLVALSIAAVLAVFLLYTVVNGRGTAVVSPSQLEGHTDRVSLTGVVIGPVTGDAHGSGLHFRLGDPHSQKPRSGVTVVYRGEVADQFRVGRDIVLDGRLARGVFVGVPGTLLTKCPSRYTAKPSA